MPSFEFDAVIIGSGFGGAVMAYRLAEAGKRVCVIERGKAIAPGQFPRSPIEMRDNFWDPDKRLFGLFNLWSFRAIDAVVASGLGGGSLIYANVLLRKDEKWFVEEDPESGAYAPWPITRAELDPHYDRIEGMLRPSPFPFGEAPFSGTQKTLAMKEAAEKLGLPFHLPNLAIAFNAPGQKPTLGEPFDRDHQNLHGAPRQTCRLCGECNIGCNYGSKNTLDLNYLTEAKRLGAVLRTLCEVKTLAPEPGGGYAVTYIAHDASGGEEGEARPERTVTIRAPQVILAAGTFGTTYLLLRNAQHFPGLSPTLGARFSGNGDLLTFAMRSRNGKNGSQRKIDATHGPVITSSIRVDDVVDGGSGPGFYLQDAGFPALAAWAVQALDGPTSLGRIARYVLRYLKGAAGLSTDSDLGAEISELLGTCDFTGASLPMLCMGRDVPDGTLRIRNRTRLDLDWGPERSEAYFDRVKRTSKLVADTLHAGFAYNPTMYLDRLTTVHPLGGCAMGESRESGVVDAQGQVFGYPGLTIADGSVMPGPVGANPALTIAALSDRFADRLLER